jgi:flagellar biogenesis protein FliO
MPPRLSAPLSEPEPVPAQGAGPVPDRYASTRLITPGYTLALVLLALGAGGALVLRRRSRGASGNPVPIQMLGQQALGQNQQLRLVRCGGEVLLLGVSSGQITLLRQYAPEAFAQDPPADGPHPAVAATGNGHAPHPQPHFGDLLRQYAGSYVNARQTETPC